MAFDVVGEIENVETFATGRGIRELPRLNRIYGRGPWRKRKGQAAIRLSDGTERIAELHWKQQVSGARNSRSSDIWTDYGQ